LCGKSLSRALADCLEGLNADDWDVETVIKRYPGLEEDLRPLLEVAATVRRPPSQCDISEEVIQRLRARLEAALGEPESC
jgi:hypothetical protein